MTSAEAASIMVLLSGRPVLARRHAPLRNHVCEAAVDGSTRRVKTWGDIDSDMKLFAAELDRAVETCEHLQVATPTGSIHLEVHDGVDARDGADGTTVVVVVPRGLHARYGSALARTLADTGPTVALLDLPGHGLSTGRRGRATRRAGADAIAAAVRHFGPSTVLVVRVPRTRRRGTASRLRLGVDTLSSVPGVDGLLSARSGPRLPAFLRGDEKLECAATSDYSSVRLPRRATLTSGRGQRRIVDAVLRALKG